MELCFNEMTVMKNGTLPEDIALCAQAGFSAVELRKGTLLRYLRGGGTLEALRQTLARCGILPLTVELLVVPPVQADRRKAELLRPRIAPGDVMLGDTEVDKSCAELLGLPWIVLDRGFRSAVYWQGRGVQPAHDLHEAARRLQNLP